MLYNLLMGFRETVLPACWFERRLRAIRDRVFLVGADLIPKARWLGIRFAVPPEERTEFLQRLRTISEGVPLAAQLDWDLSEADDEEYASAHASHPTVPIVAPVFQRSGASP